MRGTIEHLEVHLEVNPIDEKINEFHGAAEFFVW